MAVKALARREINCQEREESREQGREGWREGGMTGLDTATCCMLLA